MGPGKRGEVFCEPRAGSAQVVKWISQWEILRRSVPYSYEQQRQADPWRAL
jgi:hypothetical protein